MAVGLGVFAFGESIEMSRALLIKEFDSTNTSSTEGEQCNSAKRLRFSRCSK